jgi:acyl-CoA synthetase (AMP-forming)/AMP-acid ligase II
VIQILKHSATRATASPAFYERLIAYCSDREITLTCLKKIFAGGGLVPPRLMDELRRIAPQSTVTAVYGSTEVEPIANVSNWEISKKDVAAMSAGQGVLAGLPAPMTHVRIMKTNGCRNVSRTYTCSEFEADCLNSGQAGEIVVSGQHVLSGYLSGANDDANKFNVETTRWHRTGDMGCFDQRGRLWLLGRCSARIEDQHGTLFPFAVEAGALQHEFVRRAAAVSIGGRRILALEVHNGPLHKPQVELLFETLSYANIHKVHVLDRMPVDQRHNSRIDYPALTSLLEKSM